MYKHLVKIPTINMTREDWLLHRKNSIGGSDAASIVGLNEWCSPYSVWAEKLDKTAPKEANEAMRQGTDLEQYVAERFAEQTGKKVRRENHIIKNPDYPYSHANVDRLIVGEDAGLECKTTSSLNLKKFQNGEFPDNYYVQCMHYMMVTGCKKWYLAVLVFGRDFLIFEIERNEDEINALAQAEKDFWNNYIATGIAPTPDGSKSTTEAIGEIYPYSDGAKPIADLKMYSTALEEYNNICKQERELRKLKDECANQIKDFLGETEKGSTDKFNVSWTTSERSSFDFKKFQADNPSTDFSNYTKHTTVRTFKVTEIKK